MRTSILLVAGAGIVAMAASAHATVIASEYFGYAAGSLTGDNGGYGWSGGWTSTSGTVNAGGPSVTLQPPAGTDATPSHVGSFVGYNNSATADSQRNFATALTPTSLTTLDPSDTTGMVYFSFLVQRQDLDVRTEQFYFAGSINGTATYPAGLGGTINSGTNDNNWGVYDNTSGQTSWAPSTTASTTNTTFITGSVDLDTGVINMYVNPQGTSLPASPSATVTLTVGSGLTMTGIFPWAGSDSQNNGTTTDYGAVLFGTQYADVVPEPASLSLFAAGAAGMLIRRRRS